MSLQTPAPKSAPTRSFPTPDDAKSSFDTQDLQRAVEAYRFFYPTVSMEAIFAGNRELGLRDGKDMLLAAAGPRHIIFTANSDTPYAAGVIDLRDVGPLVVELPAGAYVGLIDDHNHRWVIDMGLAGPDAGRGGKYLILPPDYGADAPADFYVARAATHQVAVMLRAVPQGGDGDGAKEALKRVKVYPHARPRALLRYVDVSARELDSTPLRWEDNLEYWKRLHDVLEDETVLEEFRPMYGALAALGIARGQPFAPDRRMLRILSSAAKMARDHMLAEGFANQRSDRLVWQDAHWEWVALVPDDANFETSSYLDIQARDRWFVQAIGASPAMFRRAVGGGSLYFLAARDRTGEYLRGDRTYKLTLPLPVPATMFWSVTAYDARTRSQVQTPQDKAVLSSLQQTFDASAEGTTELYFGPVAPEGKEAQWIQTLPGSGFFLYFRLYGPEAASLDGSWKPSDLTPIGLQTRAVEPNYTIAREALAAISTPDSVECQLGTLRFVDGVPTEASAASLYERLDHQHAIESFLNAFRAVSLEAMRRGFLEVGVRDNDVLLFSGLMDAESLFLTANCDTVYFWTFLDLSQGPIVLEVPPGVLGTVDDMWFRWITDVGLPGPDRGQGGRYLFVPPGYAGALPEGGFFVYRSLTQRAVLLGRAFLEGDDPAPAATRIRTQLKLYPYVPGGHGTSIGAYLTGRAPLGKLEVPPSPRFVEGTGLAINTIPPNDSTFYELLHAAVQREPAEALDAELAGQFAAIGIVKGKAFQPDERMKKVLADAVSVANATARALCFRSRAAEGFHYYDETSSWMNPLFPGGYEFLRPPPSIDREGVKNVPNPGARTLHARTQFFYVATGITPAMCMRLTGIGSQYLGTFFDAKGQPLDGAKTYRLTLPPNIPAALFWSLTVYDNQTRSMLQTEQRFPRAGSQNYPTPAASADPDGSTTVYFGPTRPADVLSGNWIQTVAGKGWFVALRLYSPLAPFFDKRWRPGELELVR